MTKKKHLFYSNQLLLKILIFKIRKICSNVFGTLANKLRNVVCTWHGINAKKKIFFVFSHIKRLFNLFWLPLEHSWSIFLVMKFLIFYNPNPPSSSSCLLHRVWLISSLCIKMKRNFEAAFGFDFWLGPGQEKLKICWLQHLHRANADCRKTCRKNRQS